MSSLCQAVGHGGALERGCLALCTQEVCLPGTGEDPGAFLAAATAFANRCYGSLAASMYVHPETQQQHSTAVSKVGLARPAASAVGPSLLHELLQP